LDGVRRCVDVDDDDADAFVGVVCVAPLLLVLLLGLSEPLLGVRPWRGAPGASRDDELGERGERPTTPVVGPGCAGGLRFLAVAGAGVAAVVVVGIVGGGLMTGGV